MKLAALQKRAERRGRNQTTLDINLVSLIDVFTILIFFLLSSAGGMELLGVPKAVTLPLSTAETPARQTLVVVVNEADILVEGRRVAAAADALAAPEELIAPLKAELDRLADRPPAGAPDAAPRQALTILGDKDIPYRLLRKVMASAARAGFADVSFAVQRREAS